MMNDFLFISLDDYERDRAHEIPFVRDVGNHPVRILSRSTLAMQIRPREPLTTITWRFSSCEPCVYDTEKAQADIYFDPARLGWWLVQKGGPLHSCSRYQAPTEAKSFWEGERVESAHG